MNEATQGAAFRETILAALALPPGALLALRVPKKLLAEQGAPTSADKWL